MSDADPADFTNLKVNELKKLLKARGLPLTGNKQELVDRLKNSEAAAEALLEGSDVGDGFDEDLERELDETALEDEPTKVDEPTSSTTDITPDDPPKKESVESKSSESVKNGGTPEAIPTVDSSGEKKDEEATTETKHPKITITTSTLNMSSAARKQLRAERFSSSGTSGAASSELLKKRAERFAVNSGGGDDAKKITTSSADSSENAMKRRAERFGILSPVEVKRRHLEKLQARKLRFSNDGNTAASTAATSTPATGRVSTVPRESNVIVNPAVSVEEKKRLRAERFKIKV